MMNYQFMRSNHWGIFGLLVDLLSGARSGNAFLTLNPVPRISLVAQNEPSFIKLSNSFSASENLSVT
jgi:hypothetical protein